MNAFQLPATLTANTVQTLWEQFRAMDSTQPITLDASHTEVVTTPGVQLLLALGKTLKENGSKLTVSGKTAAFSEAFAHLGLAEALP